MELGPEGIFSLGRSCGRRWLLSYSAGPESASVITWVESRLMRSDYLFVFPIRHFFTLQVQCCYFQPGWSGYSGDVSSCSHLLFFDLPSYSHLLFSDLPWEALSSSYTIDVLVFQICSLCPGPFSPGTPRASKFPTSGRLQSPPCCVF